MYKWLYKETIESGVMVLLEEVDAYYAEGYVGTPDDYKKTVAKQEDRAEQNYSDLDSNGSALEDMDKDELAIYAKQAFKVKLDKRKTEETLIKEIKALEER